MGEDRDLKFQLRETRNLPGPAFFHFVIGSCKPNASTGALLTELMGTQHQHFWCNSMWSRSRFLHLLLVRATPGKSPS